MHCARIDGQLVKWPDGRMDNRANGQLSGKSVSLWSDANISIALSS